MKLIYHTENNKIKVEWNLEGKKTKEYNSPNLDMFLSINLLL